MRWGRWQQRILWALLLLLHHHCHHAFSLNLEGLALLEFSSKVEVDPHGAFNNWNPEESNPCDWFGVHCVDGKVETLNLKGLSLVGTLASELGKLSHLKYLVLQENHFSGAIPKEIGSLTMLELLDIRGNSLSGRIPIELGDMISHRQLLLCDDIFEDPTYAWITMLKCELNLALYVPTDLGCMNRKIGVCTQQSGLQVKKAGSFLLPAIRNVLNIIDVPGFKFIEKSSSQVNGEKRGANIEILSEPYIEENMLQPVMTARRKLLEVSSNLPAASSNVSTPQQAVNVPSVGSGSFPAILKQIVEPEDGMPIAPPATPKPSDPDDSGEKTGKIILFIVIGIAILIAIIAGILTWRSQHASAVGPWKTGLSGPLQKALVTGATKLNKSELEAACEDFSNIVASFPNCTVFKGILSSGVEIAVVSTILTAKDWSKRSQDHFLKKVNTLSQINHKNFINLLGYCEEDEPFMRMMVFEYASNGTLHDHLHSKESDHLDWSSRMRVIMGTAYCLEYMHHEVNPPATVPDLQSKAIYMTEDSAPKLCDICIWKELVAKSTNEDNDPSNSSAPDPANNVYNFGLLLLETISGKPIFSEEEGSIRNWAADYLNDKCNVKKLVDPTLKSFKDNELEAICEVIQECIHSEEKNRPTMREVTSKLKDALVISPEQAWPRLSPLWWAELEILSVEAN